MNELINEWMQVIQWWINKRMNERMNKGMNERMKEWMKE